VGIFFNLPTTARSSENSHEVRPQARIGRSPSRLCVEKITFGHQHVQQAHITETVLRSRQFGRAPILGHARCEQRVSLLVQVGRHRAFHVLQCIEHCLLVCQEGLRLPRIGSVNL